MKEFIVNVVSVVNVVNVVSVARILNAVVIAAAVAILEKKANRDLYGVEQMVKEIIKPSWNSRIFCC